MATAWVKRHVPNVGHSDHDDHRNQKPQQRSAADDAQHQDEKDFIVNEVQQNSLILPPEEDAEHPKNKKLGASSQQLRIEDFELMKTLGTGQLTAPALSLIRY